MAAYGRICVYLLVYVCICVYMRTCACICVYMRADECICVYMRVCACICVYMRMRLRAARRQVPVKGESAPFKMMKDSSSKSKKVYSYTLLGGGEILWNCVCFREVC